MTVHSFIHKILVFLNRFRARPNARRSSWISPEAIVPKDCVIGERVKLKCYALFPITIGKNCFINDDAVLWGSIVIGDNTRIMPKVFIYGKDHEKSVHIGDNVLIHANACVYKNVVVGDNVEILPGAVVFEDVPDNAIVRGNPAQVIGFKEVGSDRTKEVK